jgi:hypothetical protein
MGCLVGGKIEIKPIGCHALGSISSSKLLAETRNDFNQIDASRIPKPASDRVSKQIQ